LGEVGHGLGCLVNRVPESGRWTEVGREWDILSFLCVIAARLRKLLKIARRKWIGWNEPDATRVLARKPASGPGAKSGPANHKFASGGALRTS
jgi:hypothetical protein